MSWMGGTALMEIVISSARRSIDSAAERADFYQALIGAWEERGCDWLSGLIDQDLAFDVALYRCHPELWKDVPVLGSRDAGRAGPRRTSPRLPPSPHAEKSPSACHRTGYQLGQAETARRFRTYADQILDEGEGS